MLAGEGTIRLFIIGSRFIYLEEAVLCKNEYELAKRVIFKTYEIQQAL